MLDQEVLSAVRQAAFARTPMGGLLGAFSGVRSTELGIRTVNAAVERVGVAANRVDQISMGCVLAAGLG